MRPGADLLSCLPETLFLIIVVDHLSLWEATRLLLVNRELFQYARNEIFWQALYERFLSGKYIFKEDLLSLEEKGGEHMNVSVNANANVSANVSLSSNFNTNSRGRSLDQVALPPHQLSSLLSVSGGGGR